jgi:hypothetical protein
MEHKAKIRPKEDTAGEALCYDDFSFIFDRGTLRDERSFPLLLLIVMMRAGFFPSVPKLPSFGMAATTYPFLQNENVMDELTQKLLTVLEAFKTAALQIETPLTPWLLNLRCEPRVQANAAAEFAVQGDRQWNELIFEASFVRQASRQSIAEWIYLWVCCH